MKNSYNFAGVSSPLQQKMNPGAGNSSYHAPNRRETTHLVDFRSPLNSAYFNQLGFTLKKFHL
jgi:hypothetical protein